VISNRRSAFTLGLLLLVSTSGLTGCVSPQARDGDWERVVGTTWVLSKIDKRVPLADDANASAPLTLEFSDDGRAVGFAGVNRFFGRYESSPEGNLRFGALGSTRMYRDDPPGLMEQERHLFSILREIDAFRIDRGQLLLFTGNQKRLTYAPRDPQG